MLRSDPLRSFLFRGALTACIVSLASSLARAGPDAAIQLPLTPVIGLDPPALDFARCLAPGECTALTFDIYNAVNDPQSRLEITSVDLVAAQFTLLDPRPLPLIIPGDGTRVTFTVLFCSNGNPGIGVAIILAANAPNSPAHVPVSGDGNFPPACDAGGPYAGTVGPYAGLLGESIQFDGTGSIDPDGAIDLYSWDFGDGASGSGPTPVHTYWVASSYPVLLRITDSLGRSPPARPLPR